MNIHASVSAALPQHVAIIMDGNRRWAAKRGMPHALGHASGARRIRQIVEACSARGVRYLTLFALSKKNWQCSDHEIFSLMRLLVHYLQKRVSDMHARGVRLKVLSDLSRFDQRLQNLMVSAQSPTAHNNNITLTIAANHGGRWNMMQAVQAWQAANQPLCVAEMAEAAKRPHLSTAYTPDHELLIRTGGESHVSNFLLWQMAYTKLFFTDTLWLEFFAQALDEALIWFSTRDRCFGACSELAIS